MGQTLQKVIAYLLTFMAYAAFHALREGWSYSKKPIIQEKEFNVSKEYLGVVDALYLVFYSVGMAVLGSFMHKISLKTYVILGLVLSSICYMLWIVLYSITGFYNVVFMTILMCLNGFFQATGWPGLVGIINQWFSSHKKGLLMGIWALSANAGNIIAETFLNLLGDHQINLVWNFVFTGGLGILVAILMLLFLKEKSEIAHSQQQLEKSLIEEPNSNVQNSIANVNEPPNSEAPNQTAFKYGIISVLFFPRVLNYVLSYACLKGCIYGILFWLPTILSEHPGSISDQNGYISAMFDIGAVVGAIIVGILADYFNKKALFLSPSLLGSTVVMFLISFSLGDEVWPYYVTIFLVGMFISGPYNLIGTVIAMDIGNNIKQKGSVAKVSSLIEGFAALFTAVQMIVIPYLDSTIIFYLFAAEGLIATLLLIPAFIQELRPQKATAVIQND